MLSFACCHLTANYEYIYTRCINLTLMTIRAIEWVLVQGPVSRMSRKLFWPEKPLAKLRPTFSIKLVFSFVVKGIKRKITAKFHASRRLSL